MMISLCTLLALFHAALLKKWSSPNKLLSTYATARRVDRFRHFEFKYLPIIEVRGDFWVMGCSRAYFWGTVKTLKQNPLPAVNWGIVQRIAVDVCNRQARRLISPLRIQKSANNWGQGDFVGHQYGWESTWWRWKDIYDSLKFWENLAMCRILYFFIGVWYTTKDTIGDSASFQWIVCNLLNPMWKSNYE